MPVWIWVSMIFCHIVDDFYLQGCLKNLKQKDWWKKNANDEKYENDYIIALLIHGFSWSFLIHLPLAIYMLYKGIDIDKGNIGIAFSLLYSIQMAIHAIIDHLKANLKIINLLNDQLLHYIQIIVSYLIISYLVYGG